VIRMSCIENLIFYTRHFRKKIGFMDFINSTASLILWNEIYDIQDNNKTLYEISELVVVDGDKYFAERRNYKYAAGSATDYWNDLSEIEKTLEIFRLIDDGFLDYDVKENALFELSKIRELKAFRVWIFTILCPSKSYKHMMEIYFPNEK